MKHNHLTGVLVVALAVLLAGCAGLSGESAGQQEPVTLELENVANDTHTFESWVVELPANITIHRSGNRSSTVAIGEAGIQTYSPGDVQIMTGVDPPASAMQYSRAELSPDEQTQREFTELPAEFAILVVVTAPDGDVASIVDATCTGGDFVGLSVTMRPYGTDSALSC